jgi:hypothetical protein
MARAMLVVWARTDQNDVFTTACVDLLHRFLNDPWMKSPGGGNRLRHERNWAANNRPSAQS